MYLALKRILDVLVSLVVLVVASPLILATAVAVRLDLGSPILFRQRRAGLNEVEFELLKFRTMRTGDGADETRITPLGSWLRAFGVDELPQLVNVLRGDMSLVGPRPLLPEYLSLYTPDQRARHSVRPGLTGLAQLGGRKGLAWDSRLDLDLDYVRSASLLLDVRLMFRTLVYLVKHRRESTLSEAFVGAPGSVTLDSGSISPRRRREYSASTSIRALSDTVSLHAGLLLALVLTDTTPDQWSAVISLAPATMVAMLAMLLTLDSLRLGSTATNGIVASLAMESVFLVIMVMAITRSAYGPVAAGLAMILGVCLGLLTRAVYRALFPIPPANYLIVLSGTDESADDEALIVEQLRNGNLGKVDACVDSPEGDVDYRSHGSRTVVLSPWLNPERRARIASEAHDSNCTVRVIPSTYEIALATAPASSMRDVLAFDLSFLQEPELSYRVLKRVADVSAALVVLLLGAIPIAVCAGIIRASSPGPAIYRQDRVGRHGRNFEILKLRTMLVDAEAGGATLARANDDRVTPIGRFLRRSRIDELPQAINVLRGDMSFVGPRPERPEFVSIFNANVPGYRYRTVVRPGLSGLAQVRGRYATTAAAKLRYDLYYIRNASVLFDLQIAIETVGALCRRDSSAGTHSPITAIDLQGDKQPASVVPSLVVEHESQKATA